MLLETHGQLQRCLSFLLAGSTRISREAEFFLSQASLCSPALNCSRYRHCMFRAVNIYDITLLNYIVDLID